MGLRLPRLTDEEAQLRSGCPATSFELDLFSPCVAGPPASVPRSRGIVSVAVDGVVIAQSAECSTDTAVVITAVQEIPSCIKGVP